MRAWLHAVSFSTRAQRAVQAFRRSGVFGSGPTNVPSHTLRSVMPLVSSTLMPPKVLWWVPVWGASWECRLRQTAVDHWIVEVYRSAVLAAWYIAPTEMRAETWSDALLELFLDAHETEVERQRTGGRQPSLVLDITGLH